MYFAPTILSSIFYLLLEPVTCAPYAQSQSSPPETFTGSHGAKTSVNGRFIGDSTNPRIGGSPSLETLSGRRVTSFLTNQVSEIKTAQQKGGPVLGKTGDWIAIGSNPPNMKNVPAEQRVPPRKGQWDLGLYVRPVQGQTLTYEILGNSISALVDLALGEGGKAVDAPFEKQSFDFEVHDKDLGLVGQGVVTECEQGWSCFEPFGLDKNHQ